VLRICAETLVRSLNNRLVGFTFGELGKLSCVAFDQAHAQGHDSLREFLNDGSEPLAIRRSIPEKSAANQRAFGRQAPCLNGFDR
jgi:hypothetical protein